MCVCDSMCVCVYLYVCVCVCVCVFVFVFVCAYAMTSVTQSTGMLTREQLFHLFDRFIFLTSKPGRYFVFTLPDLFCFLYWSIP